MKTLIKNAHIISPGVDIAGGSVLVEDGKFTQVLGAGVPVPAADEVIDAGGQMLMPGFIDIHSHGAGGADTCDGTVEALHKIVDCKVKEGVTSWLPTTLTLGYDTLEKVMNAVAEYRKAPRSVKVPGVHLEGPFVNPKMCGAQNPDFLKNPDYEIVEKLNKIAPVLVITMAPELDGALDFIAKATALGVRCSAGHSAATYAQFKAAKAAGLAHLTHFCNQMSPLHHREIGLVGSGFLDSTIKAEMICDKVHLCPDMLATAFKVMTPERIMMITDSLACSGLPDGPSQLGGLPIMVKNGEARLMSGNLAGSTLNYSLGIRNIREITGLPLSEIVKATAWNQAQSLGLYDVGKIAPGYAADFVLLGDDYLVTKTFVDGVCKFTR
ncbi:MAG: N-acetylglucosamine-6-phosphate deacetylase [Opitutales bacterium]|nr:N-acetylglucosamine-6-phosphate deacetylase [Opitutales bacterium]